MKKNLYSELVIWPKGYVNDTDLSVMISKSDAARYGIVNRALKEGVLTHVKRGLYIITLPRRESPVDLYELAQVIYGPSFVSLESALQYHSLIPEAVYGVTSVTPKRISSFSTPLGVFSYKRVPLLNFLLGVERIESDATTFFMAGPWRAIADIIYLRHKQWGSLEDLCEDMRIEPDTLGQSSALSQLVENYPNSRTKAVLARFIGELT
ncbi:MAG: hypothetical protein Q8K75_03700 [Chlamydiales bacterium]|nr:hypothetical protein [Chlamydiales bacterium]